MCVGIFLYVFLTLRRVCGQGRFVTFLKMAALMFGYAIALSLTMPGTLIITVAAI